MMTCLLINPSLWKHQIFNTHVLIDEEGEIKSIYKKLHLFDVSIPELNVNLRESDLNQAGQQIVPPVITPAGPLALAIVGITWSLKNILQTVMTK